MVGRRGCEGVAALRGEHDVGDPAVRRRGFAAGQARRFHSPGVMRQPAEFPADPCREFGHGYPAARGVAQGRK